ncbi:hypothetical protein SCA6_002542 [Theobroma cacao]
MNCFPCFSSQRSKKETGKKEHDSPYDALVQSRVPENMEVSNQVESGNIPVQTFNFRELAAATKNFRQECLLGEGGFGRVYRGTLQATGQVVAVKQLDRNAMQGNNEFLVEVAKLSLLRHPNLVNLIGYCADGDQRLLVYEFMPGGCVEGHLLDIKPGKKPLDWITRMKIAYGAAQGLEYLHDKANPPVIYRDLKSSNVLLDEEFNPKLSDIGLAKLGPSADKMPMQSRVMGTYGYSAPEYSRSGKLTTTADVYSFGVVLLELITGRRAIDTTKPVDEQNLVAWAQPIFREPKKFPDMADPLLKKQFPERGLNQAVAIAAMCLQDEPAARPLMSDVVTALSFLSMATEENSIPPTLPPSISSKLHCISSKLQFLEHSDTGKLKEQHNSVHNADTDSESEHDQNDEVRNSQEGSVSSSRSSSVHTPGKSALTIDHSRRSSDGSASSREESSISSNEGGASLSQKSSAKSLFSLGHASSEETSRDAHGKSDSLSQKSSNNSLFSSSHKYSKESQDASFSPSHEDSRKSPFSSSHKSSRKSPENDDYFSSSSSSDSVDESPSSSRERSSRKLLDKSNYASQKSSMKPQDENVSLGHNSSRKSTDGSVSVSDKSSWKSQDENDSLDHNSSRKLVDGSVSLSRKSSRKSKDGNVSLRRNSSRKSPEGNVSLSRKSSRRSQEGNDSLHHNSSKNSADASVSLSRKSSRKSQHGNVSLHHNSSKGSHDESNSSGSSRKSRRRSTKVNDSLSYISSGGSQDGSEIDLDNTHRRPLTFTKAKTTVYF